MNGLWTPQSAARQTHLCPSQPHYGLHLAMFSGNNSLFLVPSITRWQILIATHLPTLEGWKAELAQL